ncbi:MAG: RHS repeat-associated core domain-containing protein [Anaerolineae bacterium]
MTFSYDNAGNRSLMSENNGTSDIRKTNYAYDEVHRLASVGFDNDGNGTVDETVSYEYDNGGLRTKLTLPGSLSVTYSYDSKGQLISLTDWDSQPSSMGYDRAGRHTRTDRPNFISEYRHDAGGRLKQLLHRKGIQTLAQYDFSVDGRGNRTQTTERLLRGGGGTTSILSTDAAVTYKGTWTTNGAFRESTQFEAGLSLVFFGSQNVTLRMGTGPDHSSYDVYIGNPLYGASLWQSFDGYAASANEVAIVIPVTSDGPLLLEIRNRPERNIANTTGYKVRFKSLTVDGVYDYQTIKYMYDTVARIKNAKYFTGIDTASSPFRQYDYTFDRAGNRTQQVVTIGATPTTTNYTYNNANQLTGDGTYTFQYDANGNLVTQKQGTTTIDTYTWDRANRLLGLVTPTTNTVYEYDGEGHRNLQLISPLGLGQPTTIRYLLDLQPGLEVVLASTISGTPVSVERYVHGPRGIHASQKGGWGWAIQDGLSSVRQSIDSGGVVKGSRNYGPYFDEFGALGIFFGMPFAVTGEPTDGNGLVNLRKRYMNPTIGQFISLDPLEMPNQYAYVSGNPINSIDPTGMFDWDTFTIEQGDTLSCIAAEGGVTLEYFSLFVASVQALNNAPYLGQSILNPSSLILNNYCSALNSPYKHVYDRKVVGSVNLQNQCLAIFAQPVVDPDKICAGLQILIPDTIANIQNIIATGKQNKHKYCCPQFGSCETNQVSQSPVPQTIPVTGTRLAVDATSNLALASLGQIKKYDNLGISFEWYQSKDKNKAGWFANVTFTVNPIYIGGAGIATGNLEGTFVSWPTKGDFGASQSWSTSYWLFTYEQSQSIAGDYTTYFGVGATLDAVKMLPLITRSETVSASLYLGDGQYGGSPGEALVNAIRLLSEPTNFEKFKYLLDIVNGYELTTP